jgi:hypothetical protein
LGVALGPEVVKQIHERIAQIARDQRVADGWRMRVDTTVVETNIHYPTEAACWVTGEGADPHDEQDHPDRRRGGSQAAQPQP